MGDCKHKCGTCRDSQNALMRMEKRLLRIEHLLKKTVPTQVHTTIKSNTFQIPQSIEEFEILEEKLTDSNYAEWLRELLQDTCKGALVPLSHIMNDDVAQAFNFSGTHNKKSFENTLFYKKVYLRKYLMG